MNSIALQSFVKVSDSNKIIFQKVKYSQTVSLVVKKKEVIHPQVPLRIPCDDLTRLIMSKFDAIKKLRLT